MSSTTIKNTKPSFVTSMKWENVNSETNVGMLMELLNLNIVKTIVRFHNKGILYSNKYNNYLNNKICKLTKTLLTHME